jgi:hypothetical protein
LRGRTQTEAQHNQRGQTNARRPNGVIPRWKQSLIYGRAEPAPPRGGLFKLGWPSGENPGITRRRFSRRDALCASAWDGRTKAEAFHSEPMHRRTPGSLAGICPGGANTFPAGVRSPPLRGVGYPSWDGLAGQTRRWRERRCCRRDALCASAWRGRT